MSELEYSYRRSMHRYLDYHDPLLPCFNQIGQKVDATEKIFGKTGSRYVTGDFSGVIDTTGHVVIFGSLLSGGRISNTGGVTIHGDFLGEVKTTGPVHVFGAVKGSLPNGGEVRKYVQELRKVERVRYVPERYTVEEMVWVEEAPQ